MGAWTAWMVAAGLQTYRDVKVQGRAPLPSEFMLSGAVFGGLSLLSGAQPQLAGYLAWGFLLAVVLTAGGPSKLVNQGLPGKAGQAATPPLPKCKNANVRAGGAAASASGPLPGKLPAGGGVTV